LKVGRTKSIVPLALIYKNSSCAAPNNSVKVKS